MTKKDFVAIAQSLKDARGALYGPSDDVARDLNRVFDSLARSVADVCEKQNAKFDRHKFLVACGVQR